MMGILNKLRGGDLRSIGGADEVVKDILAEPTLFKDTINVINHLTLTGSPAMQARGKKLLKRLRFAAS